MPHAVEPKNEQAEQWCDRCGRRSTTLIFDDVSLREVCRDCLHALESRRGLSNLPLRRQL